MIAIAGGKFPAGTSAVWSPVFCGKELVSENVGQGQLQCSHLGEWCEWTSNQQFFCCEHEFARFFGAFMPQQNVNSRVRYHELPSSSASCWRYNMWLVQNCAAHCPVFKIGSSIREEGFLYPCFFSMEEMPIRTKTHTQWLYPHDIPIYFYIHHELSYCYQTISHIIHYHIIVNHIHLLDFAIFCL